MNLFFFIFSVKMKAELWELLEELDYVLLSSSNYEIKNVEFLCNINNIKVTDTSKILFHGTSRENIDNIVKEGFNIKSIDGYYGCGFYFTDNAHIAALNYSKGKNNDYFKPFYILACIINTGNIYHFEKSEKANMGCPLKEGYDSHSGPLSAILKINTPYDKKYNLEYCIFDPDNIKAIAVIKIK